MLILLKKIKRESFLKRKKMKLKKPNKKTPTYSRAVFGDPEVVLGYQDPETNSSYILYSVATSGYTCKFQNQMVWALCSHTDETLSLCGAHSSTCSLDVADDTHVQQPLLPGIKQFQKELTCRKAGKIPFFPKPRKWK